MSQVRGGEARRSTRVPLKVVISAQGLNEPLTCNGETIVVNRHGARISCTAALHVGLKIEIYVIITDKRAAAEVVYIDPRAAVRMWDCVRETGEHLGLSLPPGDRFETRET